MSMYCPMALVVKERLSGQRKMYCIVFGLRNEALLWKVSTNNNNYLLMTIMNFNFLKKKTLTGLARTCG